MNVVTENVYLSSAERSDRDKKCFLVHRANVVHIQENVVLYSRSAWPLTSSSPCSCYPAILLLVSVCGGREWMCSLSTGTPLL